VTAHILPGVYVADFPTAIVVAVVLGVVNVFLKPVLVFLTLPLTILTFGLFQVILNALLILLVSSLVPGFSVSGLFWAVLFSCVIFLVGGFLRLLTKD
jgi:putative membrane protein